MLPGAYTDSWFILSLICLSRCSTHRGSNSPILMCSCTLLAGIFSPVIGEIKYSSGGALTGARTTIDIIKYYFNFKHNNYNELFLTFRF